MSKYVRKVSINELAQRGFDKGLPQSQLNSQSNGNKNGLSAIFGFFQRNRAMESSNIVLLDSMTMLQGQQT